MCLTTHITSSSDCMGQLEHRLGQVGSVLMGLLEGQTEQLEMLSSSGSGGSGASGDNQDNQGGDMDNVVVGPSSEMREDSLMLRETGLIAEMEREAEESGAGGWYNGNPEEVLESWSGANSNVSASQD